MKVIVPAEIIQQRIFLFRKQKVMLDRDLAELYGVTTKHLNRQVKRNRERFPKEFMFQLTRKERDELVPIWYQFKTMKHSYSLPYAFTEHGILMLSSVLHSKRAIRVNIQIMKTFVKLRKILLNYKAVRRKIETMEKKYDHQFRIVFDAIRKILVEEEKPKRQIGFHP